MPPLVDSSRLFPEAWRFLFEPFQSAFESVTALRQVNLLYERCSGGSPEAFAEKVLLDIGYHWDLPLQSLANVGSRPGPMLVLANHPRGGPEAILLFLLLSRMRPDYRVMANFLVGSIPELRPRLILVDPFEGGEAVSSNGGSLRQTLRYLKSGGLVGAFPAGEVSSWRFGESRVADGHWKPQLGRLALAAGASVLPVYFEGGNGLAFHLAGLLHPRLRTLLLPRAVMRPAQLRLKLRLGPVMEVAELRQLASSGDLSAALRRRVYRLAEN